MEAATRSCSLKSCALRIVLCAATALCLAAPSAWARILTVQPGGGGDAVTFQAGVDLMLATHSPLEPDTLLIMSGYYNESVHVNLLYANGSITLLCPAGFTNTRVNELHLDGDGGRYSQDFATSGLSIVQPVIQGFESARTLWTNCRFEGGYQARSAGDYIQSYEGCEFHGRVIISGFVGAGYISSGIHDCHFVGATFDFADDPAGDVAIFHCTFEGPADTAVIARPSQSNGMHFSDCRFSHVGYGIVLEADNTLGPDIRQCRFEDIAEDAVRYSSEKVFSNFEDFESVPGLLLADSHFRHCGTAVHWHTTATSFVRLRADTIEAARGAGLVADGECTIEGLVVTDCGGDGAALTAATGDLIPQEIVAPIEVRNSTFLRNRGAGLVVRDTMAASVGALGMQIVGCTLSDNRGAGLLCHAESLYVAGNVASHNGGPGFDVALTGSSFGAKVALNTSVLNGATGLQVDGVPTRHPTIVENNLSSFNAGSGFGIGTAFTSGAAHNDAWSNAHGTGLSANSPNLELDPGLCDPLGGDDHVQRNSPCAPAGIYGQIGALGIGCDASKIVVELSDDSRRQAGRAGSIPDGAPLGGDNQSLSDHGDDHGRDHDAQLIRAVVLGTRVLDVSKLDPLTARLGTAPSLPNPSHTHAPSIIDLNHDGYPDLLLEFDPGAVGSPPSDGLLALTISTTSGLAERGEDHTPGCVSAGRGAGHRPHRVDDEATNVPFAIRNARFDEAARQARVEFTVPGAGSVLIELFDVSGRRVARTEIVATSAGMQSVGVASDRQLSSGIYLVRLARSGEALNARIAVIR